MVIKTTIYKWISSYLSIYKTPVSNLLKVGLIIGYILGILFLFLIQMTQLNRLMKKHKKGQNLVYCIDYLCNIDFIYGFKRCDVNHFIFIIFIDFCIC